MAKYSMICCVVNIGDAGKTMKCAGKYGVRGGTISVGKGTVRGRLLDILGISEVRKEIVSMIVDEASAAYVIKGISDDMHFKKPNHGIAFSYSVAEIHGSGDPHGAGAHGYGGGEALGAGGEPIRGARGEPIHGAGGEPAHGAGDEPIRGASDAIDASVHGAGGETVQGANAHRDGDIIVDEVKGNVYKVIHVIVDKGKGGDVIDAANEAGARGGTIIHARGSGIHEVQKLFSIEIEPEKDEVFIIASTELKDRIVESVRSRMNIDEPGSGVIFVIDVNEVYGLHED
ncbi:MAG: P-II family nitrogen regulator [Oscillospiraceae bacterium]|nr:P-II family nitrogen regulator [Oscillospiraceae bacterium]